MPAPTSASRRAAARALLVLLLAACSGGPARPPEPATTPAPPAAAAEGSAPAEAAPSPAAALAGEESPADGPPDATISVAVSAHGVASLSVANRSAQPISFSPSARLERLDGDAAARPVPLGPEGPCATLLPGGELRAELPCLAAPGADPRACEPAPAGEYRFVVTSCDGRARVEGDAFHYP